MKLKTISIALAAAMLAVAIAPVSAQTQAQPQTKVKRHPQPVAIAYGDERPPLTVNKRSFLDPGPVVPVGTEQNYVTISTIYNKTPDQVAQRSKYGNETLPWPLEIPGRDSPIYQFESPRLD
jgi:hypothetical protein